MIKNLTTNAMFKSILKASSKSEKQQKIVEKGDSASWKGIFVSSPFSMATGKLGNELVSYNMECRTE